jgi:hypothetical protein
VSEIWCVCVCVVVGGGVMDSNTDENRSAITKINKIGLVQPGFFGSPKIGQLQFKKIKF